MTVIEDIQKLLSDLERGVDVEVKENDREGKRREKFFTDFALNLRKLRELIGLA